MKNQANAVLVVTLAIALGACTTAPPVSAPETGVEILSRDVPLPAPADRGRLIRAILADDRTTVAEWIASKRAIDFNVGGATPDSGDSPLTFAVRGHKLEITRMLLEAGADARRKNGFGQAPVNLASSADILALLLSAGADPNAEDTYGRTPALRALEKGDVAMLDAVLARGGRLGAKADGKDVFTWVIERKRPDMIPILLERGVDPRSPPTQALWDLIPRGDSENVKHLIQAGVDPNARGRSQQSLLGVALFHKRWEIAEILMDAGANPRVPDAPGCVRRRYPFEPLSGPSMAGLCLSTQVIRSAAFHPPMLARLKASGVDLDKVAADGNTALTALLVERPTGMTFLRRATISSQRFNPQTGESGGRTHRLAGPSETHVPAPDNSVAVRALLAAGADPNKKSDDWTPLMIEAAARGERPEFIDALLQAGARIDFDAPAPSGGSMRWPFNALRNNENELAGMRIGPFGWALLQGKPQLAVRLLQRDRRLEAADRNLAYFAAAAEAWELLLAVLPYTNNVNAANRAGVTALMLAADAGRADVVRALLAAGADVNARSVDSWPPLTEIGLYTRSMPKLGGGNTALRAAKRRGHADVARLLVEAGGSE